MDFMVATELRKEIVTLRAENSELKFQLYLRCPEAVLKHPDRCPPASKSNVPLVSYLSVDTQQTDDVEGSKSNQNESLLTSLEEKNDKSLKLKREKISQKDLDKDSERFELELEAAQRIIQDLRWTNEHFKSKLSNYELKIIHLKKENMMLKSNGLEIFQVQIPIGNQFYRSASTNTVIPCGNRRQRSISATRSEQLGRRNSLQSLLPDNYKETVASLPPITSSQDDLIPFSPIILDSKDKFINKDSPRSMNEVEKAEVSSKLQFMPTPRFHVTSRSRRRSDQKKLPAPPMKTPTLLHTATK